MTTLLLLLAFSADPTPNAVATAVANGAKTEIEIVREIRKERKVTTREVRRAIALAVKEGKIGKTTRLSWGAWQVTYQTK